MLTHHTTDDAIKLHKAAFDKLPPEKRDRILRVAVEEFANNGFENTSIQQIAKKSEISVGSVYKYFENKETLFSMVVRGGLSSLEELLVGLADSSEDILVKAETIIRALLEFSRENPALVKLYCRLTTTDNSEFLTGISQHIEAMSASIYTVAISKAQETGDVRNDVNPAFFAFLLDNIFMMLQFATSCDYYKERFFIYTGKQAQDSDELIVEQTLKFLKAAFNFKS
ncbi:MAG: TetR/AcrR family transcriptional regulator [Clostridia bacterium]|nr:TetR/AcrR family transcriptional regulator [Clostridia bacterium]MBP3559286.1 TetR/AcrR family transcriptional regulator [Clostridia bacterium]MBQ6837238.1 TetR/AcrR family transcriptional regulator [Clostridia bacterium]